MGIDIISQRPGDYGRTFRQYDLQGINTIGVFGDECFAIRYRNTTSQRIQVKCSIDGTDVLTGEKANLSTRERMWVVEPRDFVELRAWAEGPEGGASFVFTTVENSVALHTHGDLYAKNIISAAIFTEGYRPPRYSPFESRVQSKGGFESYRGSAQPQSTDWEEKGGPAVGAGEYVTQHIGSTQGLIHPVFSHIEQVRYLWWDDVQALLQQYGVTAQPQYPTGFQGYANLGNTPRLGHKQSGYTRFQ